MTKEKLADLILTTIAARKKWAKKDLMTSETLLTISIVGCFITATLAINDHIDKYVIAILGGLSGLSVVIYKRLSYARRLTWNELYLLDLQKLLTELEVTEPLIVAGKYTALLEKKEKEWAAQKFTF